MDQQNTKINKTNTITAKLLVKLKYEDRKMESLTDKYF